MANTSFLHLIDCRLCVNIDHVATVRQARGTDEPDPVRAAVLAELGGANGITVHLREDRRHIQDRDVELLLNTVRTFVNLELAAEDEVISLAESWKPGQATLVPEKREELTTEGGLDVSADPVRIADAVARLQGAGIRTSLFIDPDPAAVDASVEAGAAAIELHTGEYANAPHQASADHELARLEDAATRAAEAGLGVHAGHGLTYENVRPVAAIVECEELNIGHSIVSRAVLVGMERAVLEMSALVREARG
ncbi:pyridoxine 5'-phosphate synthase [Candidatus Palauibacter sp.]|uniref:pyridoxine 5'-phosphate synthase n=1 Tax=Candidatus Palauibacter sp. TaxID=3101350 RepID=UPI003AF2F23A